MKKKVIAMLLTAAMGATMLAGCGSTGAAQTDATADTTTEATDTAATDTSESADTAADYENCTIKFDWWGGDSRHEATQAAVDAFMKKYPGITVEVNFGAWTDWETARALEYQSGTGSDLTQINFSWINDYDADGATFVDLSTLSDTIDLTQYSDDDLNLCKDSAGGLAGIPVSITGRTFYWNKTTFDQAGIDTPKSLDDLLAAGQTFKEKLGDDYYPLSLGEYDRALLMAVYLQAQTGEPIIAEDGTFSFTTDQLKTGMEFIQSLEDNHVIPTIEKLMGDGNVALNENPNFIDGHYAGAYEWDSAPQKYIGNLAQGQELVVGDELTGLGDKCTGVFSKVSLLFAITKTSEHPHEAAMLMNYLLNDPEGVALMGTERGIPESKVAYDTLDAAGSLDAVVSEAHEKVMSSDPMYFSPLFDNAALKGDGAAYIEVFSGLSYGDYTVDDAAQMLFDSYQSVCAG